MPLSRRLPLVVPALAALAITPLHAADQTGDAGLDKLREQVAALSAQIEKLQAEKSSALDVDSIRGDIQVFKDAYARDKERNLVTNQNGRYVGVTGTLQTRLSGTSLPDSRGTRQLGIELPLASIGLRGTLYRDYSGGRNLEAQVALQTVRSSASYINVNQTVASGGDWTADNNAANTPVALADTFIRYNFLPVADPEGSRLQATFGQFSPKFGLEGSAPENLKPTIRGALFSSANVPRQLGLELAGDLLPEVDVGYDYRAPLLSYWVAVTNGASAYTANAYGARLNTAGTALLAATSDPTLVNAAAGTNANDSNNQKAITARIEFIPPHDYNSWLRQVKIGLSAAFDRSNGTASTLSAATSPGASAGLLAAANAASKNGELLAYDLHRRLGFDISYAHSPVSFTYEAVYSADSTTTSYVDPTLSIALNRDRGFQRTTSVDGFGQAITIGYIFGEQFLSNNVRDGGKWDDSWPQSFQPYVRYDTWNPNRDEDHEVRNTSIGANLFFAQTTKFQIQASEIRSQIADATWRELLVQFQYGF